MSAENGRTLGGFFRKHWKNAVFILTSFPTWICILTLRQLTMRLAPDRRSHLPLGVWGRFIYYFCAPFPEVKPTQGPYISFNKVSAISDGVGATAIPASLKAAILAAAVPLPPLTMAPA